MKKTLSILLGVGLSFNIMAGEIVDFTESKFKQLQAENKSILVDVKASWCPTCRKQSKMIKQYFSENPENDITVLVVDYDDQKKWVRYFKAPRQSTLISYIGKNKIDTNIAQSSKKDIFNQLSKIDK